MLILGASLTFIWLAGLVVVVWLNINTALELSLNEWGDFLAGGFAPLAFMWLVIGYFQQGKELKLNRETLSLQVQELRNSVEHQREMAVAAREDIELARSESEEKRAREKKQAQPAIYLREINFQGDEAWVYLNNYGCEVKSVKAAVKNKDESIRIHPDRSYDAWQVWDEEKSICIILECQKGSDVYDGSCEFSFGYVDGLGEVGAKKFVLVSDEFGSRLIETN
jgi:hypothetical protein